MPTLERETYAEYFRRSRARWLRGQTVTVAQLRRIYRSSADSVARDIIRMLDRQLPNPSLSATHLVPVMDELDNLARTMSHQSLDAILQGIQLSVAPAIAGAEAVAFDTLGSYFSRQGLSAFYHSVNQRAVVAFATRAYGPDGLRLSDRVWRTGANYRGQVRRLLADGIARGQDARRLAATIQKHLTPGTVTPNSPAVRKRLGLSSKIDYRAMRLARTEMSNAFREGTVLGNQATPSYLGSIWMLSGSHPIADECDGLAYGQDGSGFYAKGYEPDAPHPNCLCALVPSHESNRAFEERLNRWLDDPSSERSLEEWHQRNVAPFFTDVPRVTSTGDVIRKAPANPNPGIPVADVGRAFQRAHRDLEEVSRRT